MSTLAEELGHLKHHLKYPATRKALVEACNRLSDLPTADRDWFTKNLPDGTYRSADEVVSALLKKV